jgi:hypothetical protein
MFFMVTTLQHVRMYVCMYVCMYALRGEKYFRRRMQWHLWRPHTHLGCIPGADINVKHNGIGKGIVHFNHIAGVPQTDITLP